MNQRDVALVLKKFNRAIFPGQGNFSPKSIPPWKRFA
jgi:hypothetical protein